MIPTNFNLAQETEILDEYDFSVGDRGKYYQAYQNNNLTPLPGVQFLRDCHQRRTGVLLDLQIHQNLWDGIVAKNSIMENLQFLTDHQGHRLAVMINFKEHLELWQAIYDLLITP